MPACLLIFFSHFAYYISIHNYYLITTEWSNLCKDLLFLGDFVINFGSVCHLNCSLWSLWINLTLITLILGGHSIAPFKNLPRVVIYTKEYTLQSHKTLLPRGQVNTKKLIHVLKTCHLCRFISDNQNTTLDVLKLALFLQEKQTKNAAEITVKWSFTSLFRKATKAARLHIIQVTDNSFVYSTKCRGTYLKHPTR